jgi:hypothetical protein
MKWCVILWAFLVLGSSLATGAVTPMIPGDVNGDNSVGAADVGYILQYFDRDSVPPTQGDLTGDGTVNYDDLSIVLAHYGMSEPPAAGPLFATVPEPSGVALLAAAGLGLLAYRRWKRK